MGRGSYRSSDWDKLRNSRGINQSAGVNDIFRNNQLKSQYDPKNINIRESRDSEDSPESTPVIISFDDTGSMGYLATEIAKNSLNKTITEIYDKKPVTNPHVMCAAYGNIGDPAPLQVTQFEADIRIVEQLLDMWIVLRGRGDSGDPLIWYFAANHTSIDSYEKRGKKGFLFTIGDDDIKRDLSGDAVRELFGDTDLPPVLTVKEILKAAQEKYHVFHIVTKPLRSNVYANWRALLPHSTALVEKDNVEHLYMVIISIMQLVNGQNRAEIISQWPSDVQSAIWAALKDIKTDSKESAPISGPKTEEAPSEKKSFFQKIFGK